MEQTASQAVSEGTGLQDRVQHVQADGGDIELVDIINGVVQIRLAGSCVGCMYSMMTLQAGVERMLREQVPEIKAVEAVPF